MKYVLLYDTARDGMSKAMANFPAHSARVREFQSRGEILMVGTWADPSEGAMGIFTTREAAEQFVAGDPFVLNGVVGSWKIKDWNETLT